MSLKNIVTSIVVCGSVAAGLLCPNVYVSNIAIFMMIVFGLIQLGLAALLVFVLAIYPSLTFQQQIEYQMKLSKSLAPKPQRVVSTILAGLMVVAAVITGHIALAVFYTIAAVLIRLCIHQTYKLVGGDTI